MLIWVLAALAAVLLPEADTALVLKAVRFYRADPGQSPGQTQVTALIRIPPGLAQAGRLGETSLTLSIRVVDRAGKPLYEQAWQKRSVLPSPRGGADWRDLFRFSLLAGTYRLEASVVDSVSGRRVEATLPIEGYDEPPPASDLIIGAWMRPAAPADSIPQPGEFRRGGLILPIDPEVTVGGPAASLAYLFESYAGTPVEATLSLSITNGQGDVVKRMGPMPVRVAAGIGLLTGQLEIGELARGSYTFAATLVYGGHSAERSGDFLVDPDASRTPGAMSDEGYFATLSGPGLDGAFAPLAALGAPGELAAWSPDATDERKRSFLTEFWAKRDPAPRQPGNERRAQFYDGVAYTNTFYPEPGRRLQGWQTDRGRIFLREGLPTQVLRRQQRGAVPAYEVWRYFDKGNRYYIFADPTTAGSYRLVRTNDLAEPRERRWQELLTPAGVKEVVAFLGREILP